MGEFIFSLGYGGSLIVLGLITHLFIRKMNHDVIANQSANTDKRTGIS
ncbi:hypothetical protein RCG24_04340 [Neobacillus sp. OS1-32]|jgi:hypothetical protein|uniref:Uncharacterized protein n=1 Tax=Neobacillus paridis TaxID=2803862 RepID=A0ABS1THW0_9BACI|nr:MULTISPECIES: hypothetical protein [Neobacillus]MBL4950896.1 hypothetical protein [Neobacillus paridis]WML31119.1 hypothetical protein RCG24_04340 [Neobacillus sp. OS1-32]